MSSTPTTILAILLIISIIIIFIIIAIIVVIMITSTVTSLAKHAKGLVQAINVDVALACQLPSKQSSSYSI